MDTIQNLLIEKKVKKEVTFDKLVELRLVGKNELVKILCRGKLESPLKVFAHKFSATAKAAIEAAGGEAVQFKHTVMKKFIETLLNIYNIEELRGRIVTTLTLLLVYRVGAQVVLPGIDSVQLAELANRTDGGGCWNSQCLYGGFCQCFCFCVGNYAIYFGFHCGPVDGYCSTIPTKITKRGESGIKKEPK